MHSDNHNYTGCAKKKKAILNIHIKSEGINNFSQKFCWTESTIFVVNGHEMYCTCVFFYLCVAHILTRTVTELPNSKRFYNNM